MENKLHLPPKQISCRIKGNPSATLNLVHVDWIAGKLASIKDEGVYMLTSQKPLRVSKLLDWLGEVLFLNLKVEPEFKMRPHEALFDRLAKPFLVYVQDDFSRLEPCLYIRTVHCRILFPQFHKYPLRPESQSF
ncbi:hypothetical protein ES705_47707 [subsurface metagenome]